jgi:hypothetical protein
MRENRARYFALAELLGNITIIPPLPLEEAKRAVTDLLLTTIYDEQEEGPEARAIA